MRLQFPVWILRSDVMLDSTHEKRKVAELKLNHKILFTIVFNGFELFFLGFTVVLMRGLLSVTNNVVWWWHWHCEFQRDYHNFHDGSLTKWGHYHNAWQAQGKTLMHMQLHVSRVKMTILVEIKFLEEIKWFVIWINMCSRLCIDWGLNNYQSCLLFSSLCSDK